VVYNFILSKGGVVNHSNGQEYIEQGRVILTAGNKKYDITNLTISEYGFLISSRDIYYGPGFSDAYRNQISFETFVYTLAKDMPHLEQYLGTQAVQEALEVDFSSKSFQMKQKVEIWLNKVRNSMWWIKLIIVLIVILIVISGIWSLFTHIRDKKISEVIDKWQK
jgi:hypothetical protein